MRGCKVSVRRLDPVQPEQFSFSPDNLSWAKQTIAKYPAGKQASAVIPLLWRAQEQEGWTTRAAIEYVANMLGMAYIRVLEVATFYTMFQLSPVGRRAHIQVCGTIACQLRGAEDLIKVCKSRIHSEPHHVTADGNMSWEEVECLGSCVNAPMVQVFKDTYEDLTPATLDKLIDDLAAGKKVKPGPQIDRHFSAPVGGATTLIEKSLYKGQRSFKRVEAPPPPPAPAAAPAAAPVVAAAPAPVKLVETPAAKPSAAPKPTKTAEGVPELLKKPRGKADDLKLIWGVGPAFEKLLNKVGVWHFDQVASWSAKEIEHVDALLKGFHGRIKRDDWVKQAKKLASGWRPDNAIGEKPKGKK
jgi:NADH-quinone oxidoreductase subunit E